MDGLPAFTPEQLGSSVFTLAALVAFVVQFIKRQLERNGTKMRWYMTLVIALLTSEMLAALLFYAGYGAKFGNTPAPWTWVIFGLIAAAAGAGGRDLLMSFAERGKGTTVVAPAQAPESGAVAPATAEPAEVPPAPESSTPTIIIQRP